MNVFTKPSLQMKAAAELELRRRHGERSKSCYFCEVDTLINMTYQNDSDGYLKCPHPFYMQDINSPFNQKMINDIALAYGGQV